MSGLQNMRRFQIKGTKVKEFWIKLIQDLRGLVKVFSILALTESLVLTLKCFIAFFVFQCSVNYTFFR